MLRPYVKKQVNLLLPYLTGCRSVLDFGCGDLSLAVGLKSELPKVKITGVDVVDGGVRYKGIDFHTYDGKKLPFKPGAFDATISYHVFHHCVDPKASLADVMRVTGRIILMVEPVYRNPLEIFLMKIMDRLGNGWRSAAIPMPFAFQKEKTWLRWAREAHWTMQEVKTVSVLPPWLPIGVSRLFVFTRSPSHRMR